MAARVNLKVFLLAWVTPLRGGHLVRQRQETLERDTFSMDDVTWVELEWSSKKMLLVSLKTRSPKFELNSRIKSLEGFFLFACRKRPGQDPIKKIQPWQMQGFPLPKFFKEILGHNPTWINVEIFMGSVVVLKKTLDSANVEYATFLVHPSVIAKCSKLEIKKKEGPMSSN